MGTNEVLLKSFYGIRAIFFRWGGFIGVLYGLMPILYVIIVFQDSITNVPIVRYLPVVFTIPLLTIWYGSIFTIGWHGIRGSKRIWATIWEKYTKPQNNINSPLDEEHELSPFTTSKIDTDFGVQISAFFRSFKFTLYITLVSFFIMGVFYHANTEWGFSFNSPIFSGINNLVLYFVPLPENFISEYAKIFYDDPNRTLVKLVVIYSIFAAFVSTPSSNNLILIIESSLIRKYEKGGQLFRGVLWLLVSILSILSFYVLDRIITT